MKNLATRIFEDAPMRIRALRLLEVIREAAERADQPIFFRHVAKAMGVDTFVAAPAFRYLADKGWIDTFGADMGRINAAGYDVLEDYKQEQQQLESAAISAAKSSASPLSLEVMMEWDVFVSHAGEDKDQVARPLAERLAALGLRVWYDEATLTLGDSLARSIDAGLARSRFGVVILSRRFFEKEWPQRELDGLVAREINAVKAILPVWHGINHGEIAARSPTLADRLAVSTDKGLDHVALEIERAVRQGSQTLAARTPPVGKATSIQVIETAPSSTGTDLLQEATRFHAERVGTILSKKGPVELMDGGALVVHLVPRDALQHSRLDAFDKITASPADFLPIATKHLQQSRISRTGLLIGSNASGLSVPQRAYIQVSHSCRIETAASSMARGKNHNFVELPRVEAMLIDFIQRCVAALSTCGALPPVAVAASLLHMDKMRLVQQSLSSAFIPEDLPFGTIDDVNIDLGEVLIEQVPKTVNDSARSLAPIFKYLANVADLRTSPNMDETGNYLLTEAQIQDNFR